MSTPDGSKFDVIFVGTSRGQLLKAVNSLAPKSTASTRTVIIEEIEVVDPSIHTWLFHPLLPQVAPELLIKSVTVVRTAKGSGHVLVTTADQVNNVTDAQDSKILLEQQKAKKLTMVVFQIRSFALFRCDKARTCGQCVALQVRHVLLTERRCQHSNLPHFHKHHITSYDDR